MTKISVNTPAPDFSLDDYQGQPFRLSEYQGRRNLLLVFNRGFT